MSVLNRKLVRDLWSRKLAVMALVGIVAVGVGSFAGPASLYRDLDGARERYYRTYRLADLVVDLRRAPETLGPRLARFPNVGATRARVRREILVDLPDFPEPITGVALSLPATPRPVLNDLYLRTGTWFTSRDAREVILEHQFATAHGLGPGDRIKVTLVDQQHDLLVIGTAMSPEFVWVMPPGGGFAPDPKRYAVAFLAREFLQETADLEGAFNQLLVSVHDNGPAARRETLDLLERRLEPYGVVASHFMDDDPSVRMLQDEITGLAVTTTVMPVIFLGVAILILHVLMTRVVRQQRTVMGTLTALGYSSGRLVRHYVAYGATLGAIGGVAGFAIARSMETSSVAIYQEFFAMPGIEARFFPGVYLLGLALSIGVAAAGALQAARQVAKLDPADAMRPPPPEVGGRVLLERLPWVWSRLSFRARVVLRVILRNPFRSFVSVLASFLAASLILMSVSLLDAIDQLMEHQFARVSHEDYTVSLRDPMDRSVRSELEHLPGVTAAEAHLTVAVELRRGWRSKRTAVQGLPEGGRLHTPIDAKGRPVDVPAEGLVLTRKLASLLGVRPGEAVRLRPLVGERREVEAPVVGIADTYLGLTAYCRDRYLARLLGEEAAASVVLLEVAPGIREESLLAILKERGQIVGLSSRQRSLNQLTETFGDIQNVSIAIMVIFAGMIAFGAVVNMALVSLSERRVEVATYRVLGYQPGQIWALFLAEGALLNGLGSLLGLGGGVALTHLLSRAYDTEMYRFPAVVLPVRMLETLFLMALFVGAAELLLYRLLRRLDWLEALSVKE